MCQSMNINQRFISLNFRNPFGLRKRTKPSSFSAKPVPTQKKTLIPPPTPPPLSTLAKKAYKENKENAKTKWMRRFLFIFFFSHSLPCYCCECPRVIPFSKILLSLTLTPVIGYVKRNISLLRFFPVRVFLQDVFFIYFPILS